MRGQHGACSRRGGSAAGTPSTAATATPGVTSSCCRRHRASRRSTWSRCHVRPRRNELRRGDGGVGKREGAKRFARRGLRQRRRQSEGSNCNHGAYCSAGRGLNREGREGGEEREEIPSIVDLLRGLRDLRVLR